MVAIGRVGFRRETFFTSLAGSRFRGTIFPINDQRLPTLTFITPRHLLRTRPGEPVGPGDLFRDESGRMFLIAEHDRQVQANQFVLFEMTDLVLWQRATSGALNPVTKQPMQGVLVDQGMIWCAIESETARQDGGLNMSVDRQRVITGALIQRGDRVNDQTVKQLTTVLGVQIGEIE